MNQYDITRAYMLAPPGQTFYLRHPPGWDKYLNYQHDGMPPYDPNEFYFRAEKNVYGMPDAGAIWQDKLNAFLKGDLGMQTHPADTCLWRIMDGKEIAIVIAHVDDILVMGTPAVGGPQNRGFLGPPMRPGGA